MGALGVSCLALLALALPAVSDAALAQTIGATGVQQANLGGEVDSRIAVVLPADDHARIAEDMRAFLSHTADLLDATTDGDWEKVRSLAADAQPPLHLIQGIAKGAFADSGSVDGGGRAAQTDISERNRTRPVRMQKNLPQAYRDMLLQRRLIIEEIARDVDAVKDPFHTVRQISQIQRICVACHLTYRHEVIPIIYEGEPPAIPR